VQPIAITVLMYFFPPCTHTLIQAYSSIPLIQLFQTGCLDMNQTASQLLNRKIALRKKVPTSLFMFHTRNVECWAFRITFEPDPQTS